MRTVICYLLVVLGFIQMLAATFGFSHLQFLSSAWLCSPLPKTFSCSRGLETFSTHYRVYWKTETGLESKEVTKEHFKFIKGPYLRRKVIISLFTQGPVLYHNPKTHRLWTSAWHYYNFKDDFLTETLMTHGKIILEIIPKKDQQPDLPLILQADIEDTK